MSDLLNEDLTRFQQLVTLKTISLANHQWQYVTGGEGHTWLLLLHGGGGNLHTLFQYYCQLLPHFRLLAPSFPTSINCMNDLVDGLTALFDYEGISNTHVYGPSLGGIVAQVLASRHPDHVQRCVFGHTCLPQPQRGAGLRKQLQLVGIIPYPFMRLQVLRGLRGRLQTDISDITPNEIHFWLEYLNGLYKTSFKKVHFKSALRLQIDYHEHADITSSPVRQESDRVMLIHYEKDRIFTSVERSAMQAFYPHAQHHTVPEYGHLGALIRPAHNIELIKGFLS